MDNWYVVEVSRFATVKLYGPMSNREAWDLEVNLYDLDDSSEYYSVQASSIEELEG